MVDWVSYYCYYLYKYPTSSEDGTSHFLPNITLLFSCVLKALNGVCRLPTTFNLPSIPNNPLSSFTITGGLGTSYPLSTPTPHVLTLTLAQRTTSLPTTYFDPLQKSTSPSNVWLAASLQDGQ